MLTKITSEFTWFFPWPTQFWCDLKGFPVRQHLRIQNVDCPKFPKIEAERYQLYQFWPSRNSTPQNCFFLSDFLAEMLPHRCSFERFPAAAPRSIWLHNHCLHPAGGYADQKAMRLSNSGFVICPIHTSDMPTMTKPCLGAELYRRPT